MTTTKRMKYNIVKIQIDTIEEVNVLLNALRMYEIICMETPEGQKKDKRRIYKANELRHRILKNIRKSGIAVPVKDNIKIRSSDILQ